MLKPCVCAAIAGCALLAAGQNVYAQPPIGFERWIDPPSSGIVFGYQFADLFTEFSNPAQTIDGTLFAPGMPAAKPQRIIDIEIRNVPGHLAHKVVDAVWVENTGIFELDSWLINRMTKKQLQNWTRYRGYVMVDIEKYVRGHEYYYAGILQRNPHGVEWEIVFDATVETIRNLAETKNMRVVDIDHVGFQCPRNNPPGQACAQSIFDAVLVKNTGNNFIGWDLGYDWNYNGHAVPAGYQLIDREKVPTVSAGSSWLSAYLSVGVNNAWHSFEYHNAAQVLDWHAHVSRVVDLEVDPSVEPTDAGYPIYYTINKP